MNGKNPFEVLGVDANATDEEIKSAYRELAKKYHPDSYNDSPLKDLADEKMREINWAYDEIINQRKNGSSYNSSSPSSFDDIRRLVQSKRITEAEELLDGIPLNQRNAEWYYLKGTVYYSRGWLDDAYNNFNSACRLDPNNAEYRMALNKMGYQQTNGYNMNSGNPYRT
ncbi:MAG: DnaJ domain-containing protein, partial [Oscillospiraceae bacterium]